MEEEINLEEIFSMFWKKRGIIVFIVLIFAIIGGIYINYFKTPKYTSTASLILVTNDGKNDVTTSASSLSTDLTVNSKLVSTYSSLIKSNKVLDKVKSKLNINDDVENLKKEINVSSVSDTEIIKIAVTDTDPNKACNIANTLYDVFAEEAKEIYQINNVHSVDKAEVPTNPSNMNKTKDYMLFIAMGLFVSIIYVIIANALDTTVKSKDEIEKMCSSYVLASIPSYRGKKNRGGIY